MNTELEINTENLVLSTFYTDSKYLAVIEATLDSESFTKTMKPTDQAISKFAIYKNLLMSLELYESLRKVSYKRLSGNHKFAIILEGDSIDEIYDYIDTLVEKIEFIAKTDLIEFQAQS